MVLFFRKVASVVDQELETIASRPQDRFQVRPEDIETFRKEILPYWKGKSLEDVLRKRAGDQIDAISKVVKINQKDHARVIFVRMWPSG